MLPHISTLDNKFPNMKDEVIITDYSQLPMTLFPLYFLRWVYIMSLKNVI